MKFRTRSYAPLAGLLAYPDAQFARRLADCRTLLGDHPAAAQPLAAFAAATQNLDQEQLEELFTRTFDFNPSCTLEIGWHLFGLDQRRSFLLVHLREELARHGIPESQELPDHLTHVLLLLDRMPAAEAARLARTCVAPALGKMLAGLAGKDKPYENLLRSIAGLIEAATVNDPEEVAHAHTGDLS